SDGKNYGGKLDTVSTGCMGEEVSGALPGSLWAIWPRDSRASRAEGRRRAVVGQVDDLRNHLSNRRMGNSFAASQRVLFKVTLPLGPELCSSVAGLRPFYS